MQGRLKANRDLRENMKSNGVTLWMLADQIGMSEVGLCKKLRHELSAEESAMICKALDRIREGANA